MSEIARKQTAAVRQYQADHPDVDWTAHVVYIRPSSRPISPDVDWTGYDHQPKDERDAALDRCCCHPDLPRGHS
jgi:hypothetical protein